MSWCNERLAKSKRPHSIIMLDELPRTSVGKIRKFILKDIAAQHHSQSKSKPTQGAFQ
jgi:crotonobetaine/carnitine-CoA ligase